MRAGCGPYAQHTALALACAIVLFCQPPAASAAAGTSPPRGGHFGAATPAERLACQKAYSALPPAVTRSLLDSGNPNDFLPYKYKLLAYDRACFKHWDTLRPQTRSAVGNIAGFYFVKEQGALHPICAGFRLSTSLVATARHCLYWRGVRLDPTELEFRLLAAPLHAFRPTGTTTPLGDVPESTIGDWSDFVVFKVDTSAVGYQADQVALRPDVPDREFLLIPGISVYSYWFRQKMHIESWPAAVRVDKSLSCVRFPMISGTPKERRRCVITQCQTLQAMSGAPIIGRDLDTQQLIVGGIHLRGGVIPDQSPQRECGEQPGFNVGVTLPEEALQVAGRRRP